MKIQCNTCHQMASLASKLYKIQFRPRLRPGTRWGSLRRSPRPPSRLGRGKPPPHSLPPRRLRRRTLGAVGASTLAPSFRISGYATAKICQTYRSLDKRRQVLAVTANHRARLVSRDSCPQAVRPAVWTSESLPAS